MDEISSLVRLIAEEVAQNYAVTVNVNNTKYPLQSFAEYLKNIVLQQNITLSDLNNKLGTPNLKYIRPSIINILRRGALRHSNLLLFDSDVRLPFYYNINEDFSIDVVYTADNYEFTNPKLHGIANEIKSIARQSAVEHITKVDFIARLKKRRKTIDLIAITSFDGVDRIERLFEIYAYIPRDSARHDYTATSIEGIKKVVNDNTKALFVAIPFVGYEISDLSVKIYSSQGNTVYTIIRDFNVIKRAREIQHFIFTNCISKQEIVKASLGRLITEKEYLNRFYFVWGNLYPIIRANSAEH